MSKLKFELTSELLAKDRIGLWAIEIDEGVEPRMYADTMMCKLLGIEEGLPPETVYHAWYDHVDPAHYEAVGHAVAKMKAGHHAEVQYPWHPPTGGEIFVRCGGMRNQSYKRGVRLEGCHQDVTNIIHVQKESDAENQLIDKLMRGMPSPMFIKTARDSRYNRCNQAFADCNRHTVESIRGLSDYDIFEKRYADEFVRHDRETMASPGIHYFPCHPCGVGNDERLYDKWQKCIDGGDGQQYILGTLLDVTDFKRAEQAKSEFFAKASHDIRTPLNAVIGYSQLLLAGVEDPVERREYLDSIVFSSETLLDLVNDILDLSKLESGKTVVTPERCDFGELIRKVLKSATPRATSRRLSLVAEVDGLPDVEVDRRHLRQILFNLVSNAVKFTERGEVRISATFDRTDIKYGRLSFTVSDTGIGIRPEDLKTIFNPFKQATNNPSRRGTGLGLTICKQLVEAMGGTIDITSEFGRGSKFSIQFPRVRYHVDEASKTRQLKPLSRMLERGIRSLRLMVVDDIKMNLMVMKSMLKRVGVTEVEIANSGEEALQRLTAAPNAFDAVLTDMWMPDINGSELLKRIRAIPELVDLPVYAVTADVECAGNDGSAFSGVLMKPITIESLNEFLRGMFR